MPERLSTSYALLSLSVWIKEFMGSGSKTGTYWSIATGCRKKRLAVCSWLAEYGRNNLIYADEYGSICMLYCCLSDMPYDETHTWRSIRNPENVMEICFAQKNALQAQ